jgi:hypothetical protein
LNIDEFRNFISEFMKESDRAAIVLGASQIDSLLTEILKKRLINAKSELFEFNGPFGTFSAKIYAIYSTGVIDGDFSYKIHIVRKIRNDCAHNIQAIDLNSQGISQQISSLSKSFVETDYWETTKQEAERSFGITGNALVLRLSMAFLIANLTQIKLRVKPIESSSVFKILTPSNTTTD